MSAGTSYINEWVLKPEKCLWHTNRDERLRYLQERQHVGKPTPVAICVAVIKDGKTIARGRVVFMTSKAVVLFDPNTGTTRKVPVADSIVETLPSLDVPVAASAPAAPPNPPAKPAGGRQPLQAAPRP
jgi:hypothetical protein